MSVQTVTDGMEVLIKTPAIAPCSILLIQVTVERAVWIMGWYYLRD